MWLLCCHSPPSKWQGQTTVMSHPPLWWCCAQLCTSQFLQPHTVCAGTITVWKKETLDKNVISLLQLLTFSPPTSALMWRFCLSGDNSTLHAGINATELWRWHCIMGPQSLRLGPSLGCTYVKPQLHNTATAGLYCNCKYTRVELK